MCARNKKKCAFRDWFCRTNNLVCRCQRGFLKDIQLGQNIARNTALSENVFMMAICTELRIPLFVVGKPGSSKSLAKDVISTNMKAGNSQSELFKSLKQVCEYLIIHGSNRFIPSLRKLYVYFLHCNTCTSICFQ